MDGSIASRYTLAGKRRSRRNALRHGLTAETVISVLEDAEDYESFEAAIVAEYDPRSIITHELAMRLASILWRLRRATTIETALFEMESDPLAAFRRSLETPNVPETVAVLNRAPDAPRAVVISGIDRDGEGSAAQHLNMRNVHLSKASRANLAQCYWRLASHSNLAFDRLSRYEASLWRQAGQIMLALDFAHVSRK